MAKKTEKRRIQCYPAPRQKELISAYTSMNEISESAAVNIAIKFFFSHMDKGELERLKMTSKKKTVK